MHQKHCSGALQHFLEVACGPAQVGGRAVGMHCRPFCEEPVALPRASCKCMRPWLIACQPRASVQHAILLAKTAGCAATGLDLSPAMLAYAAQQAQAAGVASSLAFVEADMSQGGPFVAAPLSGPTAVWRLPQDGPRLAAPPSSVHPAAPPPATLLSCCSRPACPYVHLQRGGRRSWRSPLTWPASCWAAWRIAWTMAPRCAALRSSGGVASREVCCC